MLPDRKLGSDRSVTGLLPALITVVSIALVWMFLGREPAFLWANLAFVGFTVLGLIAFSRTRSVGYLAATLYLLACTLMLAVRNGIIPGHHEIAPAFALLLFVSIIFLVFMLLTRQIKWRGRDILELAAQPVGSEADAYTGRPHPAGTAEYSQGELLDFAAFARRKLLAMSYLEPERVVFVLVKMGKEFKYLYRRQPDFADDTWIAFDRHGNISVSISEADYASYREDLDHDQLCRSLADVFLEFFDMHRKGRDERILDRLDAMKIGLFS